MLTSLSGQAMANPNGAQIINGSVQINAIANQLNIHNSNGAIINWQNFSIGQQEITRFIQQNSTSAVLNRVVGQNPSAIMGQLLSNGHVFLLNPNGVVFGANAVVDTAGLVASSLNMSDESFLSGKYKFSGDASNGAVINRGLITAGKGGEIVLIAPTVENHGVISVEGGNILLAAGQKMTLASLDLEGIEFEVQAPTNTAMNLGKLLASGGSVGVFAGSLTNTGVINANSVTKGKDGKLWLEASGSATVGGKLSAPDITITGKDVSLESASIDASGDNGGGQIRIGGDYQGVALGPDVTNAKTVTVDAATTITANAIKQGDGGRVIVWSDENTVVNGHISATGGSQSGNGGFVETSGKKDLDFTTPVDVSATNGKAGTWLIDPEDITIDEIKASSIETALNAGSNVDIKTSDSGEGEGNITVSAAITKSEGDDATLSLDAHNKIDVNAPITSTSNKLDVKLTAGNQVNVNSSITTNGGSVATLITGTSATAETPMEAPADPATDTASEPASEPVTEPVPGETAVPETTEVASADTTPDETVVTVEETVAELNTSIAGSIETSGGDISINAGETGSVLVEGTLDASNYEAGATGGNIEVLGDQVELAGDALLDASGDAGGGTIKVGGDYQGQGDTPTATNTTVGEGVLIKADAKTDGDGGTVIVWSDDTTVFHGSISATGGEQSGDGGFAEVSGKQHLLMTGLADLRAENGEFGTLLLDPGTVLITDLVDSPGTWPVQPLDTYNNVSLGNQLELANVSILTSAATGANGAAEDIIINAPIYWSAATTLELIAGNDINIFDDIGGTNADVILNAGGDVNVIADIYYVDVYAKSLEVNATNMSVVAGDQDDLVLINITDSINITLDGDLLVQGGYSYQSTADLYTAGNMTIKLDGTLSVLGGSADSFGDDADSYAAVYAAGALTIEGKSSARTAGIEVIGGTGGYYVDEGSFADIGAGTSLVLKTDSLLVKGQISSARVGSFGELNIDAGEMSILGGQQGDGDTWSFAAVQSAGNQVVNVDNALTITGGTGEQQYASLAVELFTRDVGEGELPFFDDVDVPTLLGTQEVNAGTILIEGGSGVDAFAEIYQDSNSDQTVTTTGDLTIQGGSNDDGGGGYAQIYNNFNTDINTSVTVGGNLQLLGGPVGSDSNNFAAIANYGSATTPLAGNLTVDVGGTTLLRGGDGFNDVAALSAFTTMTLNSVGDVTLEGGTGTNADAFIAGATSPNSLNTIYLNAGDPNNPAVLNFLGNSYLIDGGGTGNIFINVSGCNPVGSCTTASPTILAGTLSANFYDPAAPVVPGVPGVPVAPIPIFIPPALLPIVNFYNPALSQVLAMNDDAYDEMKDKKELDEYELALMCY